MPELYKDKDDRPRMNRRGLDTIAARWGHLSKAEQNNDAELIAHIPEAIKQAWTSDTSTAMAKVGQHYLGFFWRNDKPGGFAFTVKKKASKYADMIHEGLKYVLKDIQNKSRGGGAILLCATRNLRVR